MEHSQVQEGAAKKEAAKEKCVVCKSEKLLLDLEDGRGICEDCAQYMNDMRP